ncbi:MAG: DUF4383 domain-containing protein [Candidatus Taylorbacteria bacterium]|nr:DUF4383 domain-containing protein [Candidatus Taylorbacteria bacterium]
MKKLGAIFGVIFIIVGILGFVPNPVIGEDSFFRADLVHDIVHLAIGAALLAAAKSEGASKKALVASSLLYLVLALVGFFQFGNSGEGALLGIAGANGADNWLHLVLAAVLFGAIKVAGKGSSAPADPAAPQV